MDDPGLPRPPDGDAEAVRLQAEEHPLIEDVPPSTPAEHCLRLMHLRAYDEAVNRLGSWSGLMAQAGHSAPADSFAAGDIKTARMFGRNFAETLARVAVAA